MDHRDKILEIVKEKGPLLPSQINRELKTNVLFASAMLSEMVDQKKLKLSTVKIGGSPLYYVPGQESSLESFAEKLSEPARSAFNSLKESKILRDRSQDPPIRVALREITDFAVPLEVNAEGYSDLFWKYYLISDDEAKELIKNFINKTPEEPVPIEDEKTPDVQEESTEVQSTIGESDSAPQKVKSVSMTTLDEVPEYSYEPSFSFSTTIDTEEKVTLEKEEVPEDTGSEFPEDDPFFDKVQEFFEEKGIEISEFEMIRKTSEYDFMIELPSKVGMLNYYCKAKSKSKINDADLSSAYVQGVIKRLPVLFIITGELTKKAEELLDSEFKSMFVKVIE